MGALNHVKTDTKTRILDVAEQLFAENGFNHTSIRKLADRADVNQAAVNYHFGSKHTLIEKVIERRLLPIDHLRMEALRKIKDMADRQGRRPDMREVLRAFIEPAFRFAGAMPGERSFLLIISRAFSEPDETIRRIFLGHFKPSVVLFFALMKRARPELPEAVLWWRLHFVIGAMGHAMRMCCIPPESEFNPPADHSDTIITRLVSFLGYGMNAPFHLVSDIGMSP
jgi:AcrR family transcriptional regulator